MTLTPVKFQRGVVRGLKRQGLGVRIAGVLWRAVHVRVYNCCRHSPRKTGNLASLV